MTAAQPKKQKPMYKAPDLGNEFSRRAQKGFKGEYRQKFTDPVECLVEMARWDPVGFTREVLNHKQLEGEKSAKEDPHGSWELDPFQVEGIEAMADVWRKKAGRPTKINHDGKRYITIRSGHGPGKTQLLALLAHIFNAAWNGQIIATAPKFDQLKTRLWSRFRAIDQRAEPWYRALHEINDTTVFWWDVPTDARTHEVIGPPFVNRDWCMLAETATKPENLAGHHQNYQLVLVDEATGVVETLWPVVFGALSTGTIQILVMISNPTKEQGTYADSHRKNELAAQYHRIHVSLEKSRRIDRKWVSDMVRKYGEDSPVVRVRCKGEFPGSSPHQLFALEWVEAARLRDRRPGDGSRRRLRVTVDVADGGVDETVFTVGEHYDSFCRMVKMKRASYPPALSPVMAADEAERMFLAHGGDKDMDDFVVDSNGVGAGTAGTLMLRGYKVIQYKGGEQSDNPLRWRNRRVQSHFNMRDALRDCFVDLTEDMMESPEDWDDLDAQMASIAIDPGTDKVDDLVTKTEMIRQGIKSPDMDESLVMQFATKAASIMPGSMGSSKEDAATIVEQSTVLAGFV